MTPRGGATALALAILSATLPRGAAAQPVSLLSDSFFLAGQSAVLPDLAEAPGPASPGSGPSLFAGREGTSLFAARAPRAPETEATVARARYDAPAGIVQSGAGARHAERIRHVIAYAEAGRMGYDAIQHGATRLPAKRPTQMTVAEIYRWIAATPGQPHAIGRYQFIPATLQRLVTLLGVDERAVFSPRLQDRLADRLLEEAGLSAIRTGGMNRHQFMNNLAEIWAGLPTSSGKSHYHGYAGNHATMTWAQFDAEMSKIFPG